MPVRASPLRSKHVTLPPHLTFWCPDATHAHLLFASHMCTLSTHRLRPSVHARLDGIAADDMPRKLEAAKAQLDSSERRWGEENSQVCNSPALYCTCVSDTPCSLRVTPPPLLALSFEEGGLTWGISQLFED